MTTTDADDEPRVIPELTDLFNRPSVFTDCDNCTCNCGKGRE